MTLKKKAFEIILGKGENASLFSCSQNVLYPSKNKSEFFEPHLFFWVLVLYILSLEIILHQTIHGFNDPEEKTVMKSLWEKEKMLLTSIFFFPHYDFLPFQN